MTARQDGAPTYGIKSVLVCERPVRMRLPFRFGDTVVRETAEAYAAVTLEASDGRQSGHAAQLMVPRWFDKRPHLSNADTVDELRQTLKAAAKSAVGLTGTIAELTSTLRSSVIEALPADTPRLAAGFGPALIEMALIDAACRGAGLSFLDAARRDLFGLVGTCPPDLGAQALRAHLAALEPRWQIAIRHTVGFDAPLTPQDVAEPPDDGLPVALTEVIASTGVRWFKIKLKGDPESDIDRLSDIAAVLDGGPDFHATLDANEQYAGPDFQVFLERLAADSGLARLRSSVLFIEQPFAREIALADDGPIPPAGVPLVIDESDDADDAFPRAAARGWAGVSVKSCKGVLRALLNAARVAELKRGGRQAILSAEDLTCQPGLCWQQDTLMAAAVGATHVERNGHHFAGGMQGASDAEKAAFLAAHGDIYAAGSVGPTLRIDAGCVSFGSLDAPGFGSEPAPDLSTTTIIAQYEESS